MNKNIFFDKKRLKKCGKNVIIGKTSRIRYPELVEIGDNVIIDDFTYISTQLKIGSYVHISSGCSIIGGKKSKVEFEDFSTLSPGVVLAAGSDDYRSGIATPLVPMEFKANVTCGKIKISKHCIVGSNSVVLPNVVLKTGSCLGALSLANKDLDEWYLYKGIPSTKGNKRNKKEILKLEEEFLNDLL